MTRNHFLGTLSAIALVGSLAPAVHAQTFAAPYAWTTTLTAGSGTIDIDAATSGSWNSGTPWIRYYGALSFIPDTSGSYTLAATGANLNGGTDTTYLLYSGVFDPLSPATGFLSLNDDFGGDVLSNITASLTSGNTYTLVSSTYNQGDTGTIDNQISGPVGANIALAGGASAPEPGSIALLGLVALPAIGLIRRRKSA